VLDGSEWHVEEPRPIPVVLDRIGRRRPTDSSAACFTACSRLGRRGQHGISAGATGAIAVTMLQDYALPADEEQVWSIYAGNARVKALRNAGDTRKRRLSGCFEYSLK
jgi:2-dehydro-3-deoxygluconokinase